MIRRILILSLCLCISATALAVEILPTVESGHWAYGAMQKLSEAGLVKGDWSGKIARSRYEFATQIAALPNNYATNSQSRSSAYLRQLAQKINAEFGPEIASLRERTVALQTEIEEAGARIDELDERVGAVIAEVKTRKYGGTSTPAVSGNFGFAFQDLNADGLTEKHNAAMLIRFEMSLSTVIGDGATINVGFAPVSPQAPGRVINSMTQMNQSPGLETTRFSNLLSSFKVELVAGPTRNILGQQFIRLSTMTLTGPLSQQPEMFWRSPYAGNIVSKAYFEGQFLTGVPKRAPEDFQYATMGWVSHIDFPYDLKLLALMGNGEGSLDAPASFMREYAGKLTLDKTGGWGGKVSVIGVNVSNDSVELKTGQGVYIQPPGKSQFNGLMNNDMVSGLWEQKIKDTDFALEVTNSRLETRLDGVDGVEPMIFNATAVDAKFSTKLGPFKPFFSFYHIPHDFIRRTALGTNFVNFNQKLRKTGPGHEGFVQDTVVSDPTIPINNSSTWSVGTELRAGPAFFRFNLQNSAQVEATGPAIGAGHYLGGENLRGGTWWVQFNNNYQPYVIDGADNNPALNTWNRSYTPQGTTTSLHQLEAYWWRTQREFITNTDSSGNDYLNADGQPYTKKNISNFSTDMRLNVSSIFGWEENMFLHTYLFGLVVNDDSLVFPTMTPGNNLFMQGAVDTTLITTVTDNLSLLLNIAYETWRSDRMRGSFIDVDGVNRKGLLEYQDRQGGVGFDWNIIPGKLNLYMRTKIFHHVDVSNNQNNFTSRQMWWEMKSYY